MRKPSAHTLDSIWGHDAAKAMIRRWLESGRLPHAMLLHGPDGVGKRSLAFAIAKAILSSSLPPEEATLEASPGAALRVEALMEPPRSAEDDLFGGMNDLFGVIDGAPPPTVEELAAEGPLAPPTVEEAATFLGAEADVTSPPWEIEGEEEQETAAAPAVAPSEGVDLKGVADSVGHREVAVTGGTPVLPKQAGRDGSATVARDLPPPPLKPLPRAELPRARYVGTHPRVDRLVTRSYPVEYTEDHRVKLEGHYDLNIVEPTGRNANIKIEQVRELQDAASVYPLEGRHRVILFFGCDGLTPGGANALLKYLEEPPSYLILILVTDHYHRVFETIRSRCASVPCHPLEREDLVRRLAQEERVEAGLARVAATLAEGRPGRALGIVNGDLLRQRDEVFEARLSVDRIGAAAVPAAAHRAYEAGGRSLGQTGLLLLALARDRMVRQLAPGAPELLVNAGMEGLMDEVALDPAHLLDEAERLLETLIMEEHPFVPAALVPLQLALWPG